MIRARRFHSLGLRQSLSEMGSDLGHLAALQVELFQRDAAQAGRFGTVVVIGMALANLLGFAFFIMLCAACAALLYEQTALSWAGAIACVAAVMLVASSVAGVVAVQAARRMRAQFGPSLEELRANAEFLRGLVTSDDDVAAPRA